MLCIIVSCVCLVFVCVYTILLVYVHCKTNTFTAQLLAKVDQQQLEAFL